MLKRALFSLHRTLILAVLAIALVATGFAHRAPSTADNALSAVLLAGGSLADFCGDTDPGAGYGGAGCLACHITAAADLPPAGGALQDLDLVVAAEVTAPRAGRAILRILDLAHAPQGPPTA